MLLPCFSFRRAESSHAHRRGAPTPPLILLALRTLAFPGVFCAFARMSRRRARHPWSGPGSCRGPLAIHCMAGPPPQRRLWPPTPSAVYPQHTTARTPRDRALSVVTSSESNEGACPPFRGTAARVLSLTRVAWKHRLDLLPASPTARRIPFEECPGVNSACISEHGVAAAQKAYKPSRFFTSLKVTIRNSEAMSRKPAMVTAFWIGIGTGRPRICS